jgi:hypothetical protein
MRLAFFILLLANVVLFVWGQGYLGTQEGGREPERLKRQLQADRLQVLPMGVADKPAEKLAGTAVCKRIEWLTGAEVATAKGALGAGSGIEVIQSPRKEAPAHWVVIPDLPNRAAAEKKKAELRQLGIDNTEIVEHGAPGTFAVSLGIFRNQPLAEDYLQTAVKKGVRTAKILSRELPPERYALELRGAADAINKKLPELMVPLAQAGLADCPTP